MFRRIIGNVGSEARNTKNGRLGHVMPSGGAHSATLERMTALSLTWVVREHISSSDHFGFTAEADTYELAV
jgi:hypothetical protein